VRAAVAAREEAVRWCQKTGRAARARCGIGQPPARERGRSCVRMLRMTECKKRNRYTPIEIIKNTIPG
jgi:hypothetical protein